MEKFENRIEKREDCRKQPRRRALISSKGFVSSKSASGRARPGFDGIKCGTAAKRELTWRITKPDD